MFNKILVANRGEIACRVIRSCQRLGVRTVAVYSEADKDALHVRMADEAYLLGPAPASESYLNIVKIVEAAESSGAEAIHPGYGFLSENAAFAVACRKAGIKFIGPRPEVMEKMGDKVSARKFAKKAGIPVIPGTNTAVGDKNALKQAKKIGFPLMVKAAAGGGGIGMQIVHSEDELSPIIARARHQAQNSFGSRRLYFERYLEHASHIEVQILADERKKTIHLLERDCSVQRRNQKIVEIAPSIKMTKKLRRELTKYALKLAKHVGYTNAGTVEFLVTPEGEIFFLEMNMRLQVEHGITEMITGVDLVEMQLRIASGEKMPYRQKDIASHGFAMEARIYAEDPDMFLPSSGTITNLQEPTTHEHVRVDGHVYTGYKVDIYYDPLLAKLMCWGETREEARTLLSESLAKYRVGGVQTNVPFLQRVVTSEEFKSGKYDTWLVDNLKKQDAESKNGAGGLQTESERRELAAATAVALVAATEEDEARMMNGNGHLPSPWRIAGRMAQMSGWRVSGRGWR